MGKIVYNKENSGKQLGRGGPRDIQMRQRLLQEDLARRNSHQIGVETESRPKMVVKSDKIQAAPEVDLSQYLPLSKVKKKIEDAVEFVKKSEKQKYEDSLNNLNVEIKKLENLLEKQNLEIIRLSTELGVKESLLKTKESIYENLQIKMDKIYERVSDGSIRPFIGHDRPELEDRIFIDPIEEEEVLDPHIEIKEESATRNMNADINKLRSLLRK